MNTYPLQTTLVGAAPLVRPAPRGAFHYSPVVKTLPGELRALANASHAVWRRMTPLLEIATKRGDNEAMEAQSLIAQIGPELRNIFSVDRAFFLDLRWLKYGLHVNLKGGVTKRAVDHILTECNLNALRYIPVVRPGEDRRIIETWRAAIGFSARGVCIRTPISGVVRGGGETLRDELEDLMTELGVERGGTDLFLDLGYIGDRRPTANDTFNVLQELDPSGWRTLVLAGTVVPDTLKQIPEETIGELTRHEWLIWNDLASLGLGRQPGYGDYVIQHPTRPMEGGPGMRANVRYTGEQRFLFARGTKLDRGNYGQYQQLCRDLRAQREFRGPRASWGEEQIDACARGEILPKAPQEWRAIGTSQHIEEIVRLLGNLDAA